MQKKVVLAGGAPARQGRRRWCGQIAGRGVHCVLLQLSHCHSTVTGVRVAGEAASWPSTAAGMLNMHRRGRQGCAACTPKPADCCCRVQATATCPPASARPMCSGHHSHAGDTTGANGCCDTCTGAGGGGGGGGSGASGAGGGGQLKAAAGTSHTYWYTPLQSTPCQAYLLLPLCR